MHATPNSPQGNETGVAAELVGTRWGAADTMIRAPRFPACDSRTEVLPSEIVRTDGQTDGPMIFGAHSLYPLRSALQERPYSKGKCPARRIAISRLWRQTDRTIPIRPFMYYFNLNKRDSGPPRGSRLDFHGHTGLGQPHQVLLNIPAESNHLTDGHHCPAVRAGGTH
jgi:hypothetical protein